ncbi:hypothetical protein ACIHFE_29810 [Streptomyces sp. NPDC052396]|uniref:hypothetical protein n=1 Tax=Streptomyces sp. NPDC052396 TaxID=3365689 RepID=UPI0037D523FF
MMEIPGYGGRPLVHRPELLDEPLFWAGHLSSSARGEDTQKLLFGADYEAAEAFHRELIERGEWPVFTVPVAAGHLLHVVCRMWEDDPGVDYLLHGPSGDGVLLATDDGHFTGPALSWPELLAASYNALPGGSTTDSHSRLLLMLPALGDHAVPDSGVPRLAAALSALTFAEAPEELATALLEDQGPTGPSNWTTLNGIRVDDGPHSCRNPGNAFALTFQDQARVTAAFTA